MTSPFGPSRRRCCDHEEWRASAGSVVDGDLIAARPDLRFDASCSAHERRDSRKNEMHTLLRSDIVRSGGVGAWPFTHLRRALPLVGLALEIRLVLSAQHAVHLVHVASDSRSLDRLDTA
jgi:hypothetical protein